MIKNEIVIFWRYFKFKRSIDIYQLVQISVLTNLKVFIKILLMSNIGNRIIIDQLPSLNETPDRFNNKPQHAVHVKLFTVFWFLSIFQTALTAHIKKRSLFTCKLVIWKMLVMA